MHFEYAIEPRAIASSWEKCLYLSEKFGFDKGRVLALYPRRWLAMALEEVDAGVPPKQKTRIHAKLRALKRDCSIASGRNYYVDLDSDPMQSWLKNALEQQGINPFHAIIATNNPEEKEFVLTVDQIEETHPLMVMATSDIEIPSNIDSLSRSFQILLQSGSQIAFVDRYFSLYDRDYRRLLYRCLQIVKRSNPKKDCKIEIHYRSKNMPSIADLDRDYCLFTEAIPEGMFVDMYCWSELEGGEDFHDRYLLTDKGGIKIGRGFKVIGSEKTVNLNLMNLENSRKRLDSFSINSPVYELVDRPIRIFSEGEPEMI